MYLSYFAHLLIPQIVATTLSYILPFVSSQTEHLKIGGKFQLLQFQEIIDVFHAQRIQICTLDFDNSKGSSKKMAGKLKTFQNLKKSLCNTAADVTKGKKIGEIQISRGRF